MPSATNIKGAVLREYRIEAGRQQQQLAEEVGISPQYLCDLEKERRSARPDVMKRLADALGVPMAKIRRVDPMGGRGSGKKSSPKDAELLGKLRDAHDATEGPALKALSKRAAHRAAKAARTIQERRQGGEAK